MSDGTSPFSASRTCRGTKPAVTELSTPQYLQPTSARGRYPTTPCIKHDGHDTGVSAADQWLSDTFGPLLRDPRFMENLVFMVTFDEGRGWWRPNHVYTVVYGDDVIPGSVSDTRTDHYGLLRTIEEILALGSLGHNDSK